MTNHTITTEDFIGLTRQYDLIWIGEIHGIRENYKAYEILISLLTENGFNIVVWEMPADFNELSRHTEDGRVNSCAILFLAWLCAKMNEKKIKETTYFGDMKENNGIFQNREKKMAAQVVRAVKDKKCIIITGNFHMGGPRNMKLRIEPCLDIVKRITGLKILKVALSYAGGTLYNFGLKEFSNDFYFGDKDDLEFGTMTKRTDEDIVFFHVGKAHAVFKHPAKG